MSIRGLKKWALLLTFWLALQTRYGKASPITGDTVSGDFTATGDADVQGSTLTLGTRSDNSNPGSMQLYTDGTTSILEFDASRSANIWKWQQNGGATLKLQMSLDNNNALVLYNQASTPVAKITLDPLGTSTFENSLTVNGTDTQMPNQTLTGTHSVLTEGLGDSRYAAASNFAIGSGTGSGHYGPFTGSNASFLGGTSSGAYCLAVGPYATASDSFSLALGNSTASGYGSTAIGRSQATAWSATALGSATASGAGSLATGAANASGGYSVALGRSTASGLYSTASGDYRCSAAGRGSVAMGVNTSASGYGAIAMGWYSSASNSSTVLGWYTSATGDYSFAAGNGTQASGNSSTAFGSGTTASGQTSVAMGNQTIASGYMATAMGRETTAGANYSTTSGAYTSASGVAASGLGLHSTASGYTAIATGYYTTAPSFSQLTLGKFNVGGFASGGDTGWVSTDPLLELGNGTDSSHKSDALVVYKNGDVAASGVITAAPGGDIPMFTGN